ncbi:hypothetical protein LCGC14_3109930 [marine sediment metagenome]|uniref:Uncharacterized protein n=1 Tax=marine sediment metagenome TaxID=412755 RepID=A0A0F8WU89_9ZZZZ
MVKKLNKPHNFRVGDVVKSKDNKYGLFVVSGTKGWVHATFHHEDGRIDAWISLAKEIGAVSLLTHASEYILVTRRENVGKEWWKIFSKGEK